MDYTSYRFYIVIGLAAGLQVGAAVSASIAGFISGRREAADRLTTAAKEEEESPSCSSALLKWASNLWARYGEFVGHYTVFAAKGQTRK